MEISYEQLHISTGQNTIKLLIYGPYAYLVKFFYKVILYSSIAKHGYTSSIL